MRVIEERARLPDMVEGDEMAMLKTKRNGGDVEWSRQIRETRRVFP